jgi:hypothetical protein
VVRLRLGGRGRICSSRRTLTVSPTKVRNLRTSLNCQTWMWRPNNRGKETVETADRGGRSNRPQRSVPQRSLKTARRPLPSRRKRTRVREGPQSQATIAWRTCHDQKHLPRSAPLYLLREPVRPHLRLSVLVVRRQRHTESPPR